MGIETAAKRGVAVHYGPRTTEGKYGRQGVEDGRTKSCEWTFDFDDLPAGYDGNLGATIPANASIVSATLEILTPFTSTSTTSDLNIGLEEGDATAIDVDGLIAAAEATQATIAVDGALIAGAGALVGFTIGAEVGQLVVLPSVDDLTAGKGRVIVEYIVDKSGK